MLYQELSSRWSFVGFVDEYICVVGEDKFLCGLEKARYHTQILEISSPPNRPNSFLLIVSCNYLETLDGGGQNSC